MSSRAQRLAVAAQKRGWPPGLAAACGIGCNQLPRETRDPSGNSCSPAPTAQLSHLHCPGSHCSVGTVWGSPLGPGRSEILQGAKAIPSTSLGTSGQLQRDTGGIPICWGVAFQHVSRLLVNMGTVQPYVQCSQWPVFHSFHWPVK